jgi:hypothetical protein
VAELKTKKTEASVDAFLQNIADPKQRDDAIRVMKLMREITGEPPKMWGTSIVGFGNYHYKYDSGQEGDWFIAGFSPRKGNLTLYLMPGFDGYAKLLEGLGKYKTGKSCLYIKNLDDVDWPTLTELVRQSVAQMRQLYAEKRAASEARAEKKRKKGRS